MPLYSPITGIYYPMTKVLTFNHNIFSALNNIYFFVIILCESQESIIYLPINIV
jgi:hypothetical protein